MVEGSEKKAFDVRVTIMDPKTGRVVKHQPYELTVVKTGPGNMSQFYKRDGKWHYPNGDEIPAELVDDAKNSSLSAEKARQAQSMQSLQAQIDQLEMQKKDMERRLSESSSEKPIKVAEKLKEEPKNEENQKEKEIEEILADTPQRLAEAELMGAKFERGPAKVTISGAAKLSSGQKSIA